MTLPESPGRHPPAQGKRVALPVLLVICSLVFVSLGVWQVQRRTEKLALIAAVDSRAHAAPVAAPGPPQWSQLSFRSDAYRAVRIHGTYLPGNDTLVQAVTDYGPGHWVLTPLRSDAGWTVLVNRGFIPADARGSEPPAEPITVTGLLRMTEPAGGFLHSNNPQHGRWYSRDVAAIGRARHLGNLAPYFIDEGPGPHADGQPIGGLTVISFPNNHLQYALTWFALAVLSVFGAVRAWRAKRTPR